MDSKQRDAECLNANRRGALAPLMMVFLITVTGILGATASVGAERWISEDNLYRMVDDRELEGPTFGSYEVFEFHDAGSGDYEQQTTLPLPFPAYGCDGDYVQIYKEVVYFPCAEVRTGLSDQCGIWNDPYAHISFVISSGFDSRNVPSSVLELEIKCGSGTVFEGAVTVAIDGAVEVHVIFRYGGYYPSFANPLGFGMWNPHPEWTYQWCMAWDTNQWVYDQAVRWEPLGVAETLLLGYVQECDVDYYW